MLYAFLTKTRNGWLLELRDSTLSFGKVVFSQWYMCKSQAKRVAVQRGAKAWNY